MIVIPSEAFVAESRDLGEPREASRSLRRINRAIGSHPYQRTLANRFSGEEFAGCPHPYVALFAT
jgi:hypothetical protein